MYYALQHPDEVDKLIVVDIAPKQYDVRHDVIVEGLKSIPIDSITSRQQADEALARYIPNKAVRQFLLKNLMRKPAGGFGWRINLPVIEKLEAISAGFGEQGIYEKPALFIRGSKSDYITENDREVIKNTFPHRFWLP